MPATNELKARINACRAILGTTNEPHGIAWNCLTSGYRAALLKVAGLPLNLRHSRWEEIFLASQRRIIQAAIDSEGLRRFLDAVQPLANRTGGAIQ